PSAWTIQFGSPPIDMSLTSPAGPSYASLSCAIWPPDAAGFSLPLSAEPGSAFTEPFSVGLAEPLSSPDFFEQAPANVIAERRRMLLIVLFMARPQEQPSRQRKAAEPRRASGPGGP